MGQTARGSWRILLLYDYILRVYVGGIETEEARTRIVDASTTLVRRSLYR
jgi:hypothetical protein